MDKKEIKKITDYIFLKSNPQKADLALVFGTRYQEAINKVFELYRDGLVNKILLMIVYIIGIGLTFVIAKMFKKAGFKTIRLGLEFSDQASINASGGKITISDYMKALVNLKEAGFTKDEIGTYLLYGYPYQRTEEVKKAADFISSNGSLVKLTMYSPILGTQAWGKDFDDYIFDPSLDPLLTNNSLTPFRSKRNSYEEYRKLKIYINELNKKI